MTGHLQDWLEALTAWDVVGVLIGAGAILGGLRWMAPGIRKANAGLDALHTMAQRWHGTPEERDASGAVIRPAEPGILARLDRIEYEVKPNHGGSAHDAVMRSVDELRTMVADLAGDFGAFLRQYNQDLAHTHPGYRPWTPPPDATD